MPVPALDIAREFLLDQGAAEAEECTRKKAARRRRCGLRRT